MVTQSFRPLSGLYYSKFYIGKLKELSEKEVSVPYRGFIILNPPWEVI